MGYFINVARTFGIVLTHLNTIESEVIEILEEDSHVSLGHWKRDLHLLRSNIE